MRSGRRGDGEGGCLVKRVLCVRETRCWCLSYVGRDASDIFWAAVVAWPQLLLRKVSALALRRTGGRGWLEGWCGPEGRGGQHCSGHTEELSGPGELSETCTGNCGIHEGDSGTAGVSCMVSCSSKQMPRLGNGSGQVQRLTWLLRAILNAEQ